jgi:nucleotide-binding universal stress UspA family protein
MMPIHTLLHPTDFSEHSRHAFQLASALARDYGARLVVLHVATPPVSAYGGVMTPPPAPPDWRREAREQLLQVGAPESGVRVERQFEEGDPVTEILRAARESNADLIVMGTHGRTGVGRLLMGSVAEQVVRKASCPVLTLRTPFPDDLRPATPEGRLEVKA